MAHGSGPGYGRRWGTQLELVAARLALLRGDQQNFEQAVETARDNLRNFFDDRDPTVTSALQVLGEMQAVKVDPPRPDISQPLNTLRRLTAGDQGSGQ